MVQSYGGPDEPSLPKSHIWIHGHLHHHCYKSYHHQHDSKDDHTLCHIWGLRVTGPVGPLAIVSHCKVDLILAKIKKMGFAIFLVARFSPIFSFRPHTCCLTESLLVASSANGREGPPHFFSRNIHVDIHYIYTVMPHSFFSEYEAGPFLSSADTWVSFPGYW